MIWAVVAGASLIAGIIQTVTGFGSVVFLMMVLPFYFDMIDAPTLAIVTNQLFCMALCWKYRKYIRWRLALPPTLAFGAANLLTLPFVNGLDLHVLARVFAVFLMALAVYFLVVARRMCIRAPKPAAGVVCGALCGTRICPVPVPRRVDDLRHKKIAERFIRLPLYQPDSKPKYPGDHGKYQHQLQIVLRIFRG